MRLEMRCSFRYPEGASVDVAVDTQVEATALTGPSGSGKSTVAMLIAGLLRPLHGHIRLDGQVLADTLRRVWVPPERRALGVVFQQLYLFPHRSVAWNLRYAMKHPNCRSDKLFQHLVDVLEVGHLLPRYPSQLSGGERQRVALGRAILRRPRMLILDEPFRGLDQRLKSQVVQYVRDVTREASLPLLMITHHADEVQHLAQTVISMRDGQTLGMAPVAHTIASQRVGKTQVVDHASLEGVRLAECR